MMRLADDGPDTYVGVGPRYRGAAWTAGRSSPRARGPRGTVDERFRVHSLDADFIRRGDQAEPIRFGVDRTRNGRASTRRWRRASPPA